MNLKEWTDNNKFKAGDKVIAFTGEVGTYVDHTETELCHRVNINGLNRVFRAWDIGPYVPR